MTGACVLVLACGLALGSAVDWPVNGNGTHVGAESPGSGRSCARATDDGWGGGRRMHPATAAGDRGLTRTRCPTAAAARWSGSSRAGAGPRLHAPAGSPLRGAGHSAGPAAASDRWFAEDKLKHFFVSYAATGLSFAIARTAGLDGSDARRAAVVAAAAAGLGKEFVDRGRGHGFSVRDLVWDGAGIAAAWALASHVR